MDDPRLLFFIDEADYDWYYVHFVTFDIDKAVEFYKSSSQKANGLSKRDLDLSVCGLDGYEPTDEETERWRDYFYRAVRVRT